MPDWMSLDALKPAPTMDTVRFESVPPGAEARMSNEQTCRTPCALALPANSTMTVTFTLIGYEPTTQKIEPVAVGTEMPSLQPNPAVAELVPIPPPPKPMKHVKKRKPIAKKKPVARKPAPKKPATASTAPMPAQPVQQQQAPWPAAPQPTR
ncbi:MAG: PEGA domain-containing protein [Pseudolabrys sp.]